MEHLVEVRFNTMSRSHWSLARWGIRLPAGRFSTRLQTCGTGFRGAVIALTLLAVFAYPLWPPPSANANEAGPPQTPAATTPDTLRALAEKTGFKNLTICEQKLLKALPLGEYAVCGPNRDDRDPANDPSKADDWPEPETRQISAKLIRWLCVNKAALGLIDPKGIQIYGAKVPDPLDLDFISVPFPICFLHSFLSNGMSLLNAHIGGLFLMGSRLSNPNGYALYANRADVKGSVFLRNGFSATGEVNLVSATVGSNLECDGGTFNNPNGTALRAAAATIKGNLFLNNEFSATGGVNLVRTTVGGDLVCTRGTFSNPNKDALNAAGANVRGDVFLNVGFSATGEVNLVSVAVGSALIFSGAILAPQTVVEASSARITNALWWTGIRTNATGSPADQGPLNVKLALIDTTAGSVIDDESSWPKSGQLFLSGFKFGHLEEKPSKGAIKTRDAGSGLKWLRLQNTENALPTEPYENFAKVLESQGDDSGARLVRIAMEDDLRATLPWYRQIWPSILGATIAYGYKPWLALWWALGLVVFGYLSFSLGYQAGVIAPTDKDAFAEFRQGRLPVGYQPFNGFVYALDTFLPIINLGIKDRWMPDPNLTPGAVPPGVASKSDSSLETKPLMETWLGNFLVTRFPSLVNSPAFFNRWFFKSGRGLRLYYWVHLLLGWVLVTLFAAGFTGIIRR